MRMGRMYETKIMPKVTGDKAALQLTHSCFDLDSGTKSVFISDSSS